MTDICREHPEKWIAKKYEYVERQYFIKTRKGGYWNNTNGRFTESCFLNYETTELPRLEANTANYNTVLSGVNHKTGRLIRVNGPTYKKLIREMQCKCCSNNGYYELVCLEFKEIRNVCLTLGKEAYMLESVRLKQECEAKQAEENLRIAPHNALVDDVIAKINLLTSWNDFVEFEGKKYGLPPKPEHETHDCDGTLYTKKYYFDCSCSTCENWAGCGRTGDYYVTVCTKCENRSNDHQAAYSGKWSHRGR